MEDEKLIKLSLEIVGLTELLEKVKGSKKQLQVLMDLESKVEELKEYLKHMQKLH